MRRVAVFDLGAANVKLFEDYESRVLPLLRRHGARLESRLRAVDGTKEVHVLFFPSEAAYQAYRSDPQRIAAQDLWRACGATVTSFEAAPEISGPS